ncbi:unnamed protein product [Eruca vesicaria subsp. sativa]|uniref:F-box associated beta-propeller type 3 domain-containing protein n=1 Tax=Eruca vesicaria subsp. sativa TaxID=29727 RepID=A0ABC8L030_ERUVS|nr:unnamed protein product [Eruca vesicaria subsp. sativa]
MRIWVLENDEKQDWSEYAYTLSGDNFRDVECDVFKVYVAGMTSATGEIVLMNRNHSEPFYVFYFHPERNVIRRVQVQGLVDGTVLDVFVDHVDDLTFDMKSWQLDFPRFESINKFNALSLLEDM